MKFRVEFSACCPWPDFFRAARRTVTILLLVLVVLIVEGRVPIELLVK